MDVFYVMLAIVATGIVMIIAYIFRNKIHNLLLGRDRDVTEEDLEQLTQRNKFSSYLPWRAYDKENKTACEKCRKEAKNNNVSEDTYCTACSTSETNKSGNNRRTTESSETMYQRAVNKKLATMLKAPNTPLIAPPQVMRVLVLPYKGDMNELYMMRYIYLLIDDPKWVVGNYLIDAEE